MSYNIPDEVRFVLRRLSERGFEAYPVGGCVRDTLIGRVPSDWDITTSARPDDILRAFGDCKCFDLGKKYGTIGVLVGGEKIEITTFRREAAYTDMRRPDEVYFADDLKDDLSRRDFTINALAFDASGGVIDRFGGRADLEAGLIRTVGDAETRFREDALRIMRALRFSSELGFSLDGGTRAAVMSCRGLLSFVARERIYEELRRLVCGKNAARVIIEYKDVLSPFLPCLSFADEARLRAASEAASLLPPDFVLRVASLVVSSGVPDARECARDTFLSLKSDRAARMRADAIISAYLATDGLSETELKIAAARLGEDALSGALMIKRAAAQCASDDTNAEKFTAALDTASRLIASGECLTIKDLKIDGSDLIAIGIAPSPRMGVTLNTLLSAVIEGKVKNERGELISYAKNWRDKT